MTGCHFSSLSLTSKLCFELLKIIATTNHNNWCQPDKETAGTNTQLILKSFWKKVNQIPQSIKTSRRLFSRIYPKSSSNHQHIFGYVRINECMAISVCNCLCHFSSLCIIASAFSLSFLTSLFLSSLMWLTHLWARQILNFFVLLSYWLGQ